MREPSREGMRVGLRRRTEGRIYGTSIISKMFFCSRLSLKRLEVLVYDSTIGTLQYIVVYIKRYRAEIQGPTPVSPPKRPRSNQQMVV